MLNIYGEKLNDYILLIRLNKWNYFKKGKQKIPLTIIQNIYIQKDSK